MSDNDCGCNDLNPNPTPIQPFPTNGLPNPAYNLQSTDCNSKYPEALFYSTHLNTYINSYSSLRDRIARSLGAPVITLEVHEDQVNENIAIAVEMYSRYAGFTREGLIFDSRLYEPGRGVRLDSLFTLSRTLSYWKSQRNQNAGDLYKIANMVLGDPYAPYKSQPPGTNAVVLPGCGCSGFSIVQDQDGKYARVGNPNDFALLNSYDYMINDYRKVIDVISFNEGSNGGINTLFTIEQSLAQQAYYAYAMGNFGFDLVSWYEMSTMLKDRNKLLAQNKRVNFDKRSQYMQLIPEPAVTRYNFTGIVDCYVERPLTDLLKETWVYQYALALTKINLGYIRGRFQGVQLFGGVTINDTILAQGQSEKDKLEEQLYKGANPGNGAYASGFFMG